MVAREDLARACWQRATLVREGQRRRVDVVGQKAGLRSVSGHPRAVFGRNPLVGPKAGSAGGLKVSMCGDGPDLVGRYQASGICAGDGCGCDRVREERGLRGSRARVFCRLEIHG